MVFAAAFMPWGEIKTTLMEVHGEVPFVGDVTFGPMETAHVLTGWSGYTAVLGVKLPNWLVVFAAAAVALSSWLTFSSGWESPVALPVAFAAYGLVHACFAAVLLVGSHKGRLGIGVILTALAFLGMLVAVVQQHNTDKTTNTQNTLEEEP